MVAVAVGTSRSKILAFTTLITFALGLFVWNCTLSSANESKRSGVAAVSEEDLKKGPKLDVPYEPTSYEIAEEMLRMADVRKDDLVYDLGCGDGRIVIMAAKERGAKGVGVDLDPQRIKESVENAKKAGVTDRVSFFRQDLFKTDFRNATVMMLYLWPEVNLRLRHKLIADLKPGTRVVSHSHTMADWKPDSKSEVSNHNLYFWVIPANVTGTWTWLMPAKNGGTSAAVLQLSQHYQEVKGNLTIDGSLIPISDVMLTGYDLRFTVETKAEGQKRVMRFEGRAQGDGISGSFEVSDSGTAKKHPWEVKRDSATKVPLDR
jgi:SAM-dependent methyltransferase